METTRQTILGILRRRQATVGDLTKELRLAPATIRRHLDILARDGHIEVTQARRKTGRPHYVFSLSEKGEDLFPRHYVRITNRLIEEIVSLSAEETAGRNGRELADLVFEKMAHRLAGQIAPHLHGSSLDERVRAATDALAQEGIVFDVERSNQGYLLVGHGCPCPRAGSPGSHACAHDQRLLALLLGADVSCVEPESAGHNGHCAYRVRPRETAGKGLPSPPQAI
jgi:predicted ArsR family transcriptional regulator